MRRLARMIERLWDGEAGLWEAPLRHVLAPAEWLWRAGHAIRARSRGPTRHVGGPVISVGNLAVGGTGKTPLVGWVTRQLIALGETPGVVVHGVAGDEAELLRTWVPGVPIVADADRVRGASALIEAGASIVVADDGFQHLELGRALDLVVWAAEDSPQSRVLPRGRLREPLGALRRADAVVLTRRSAADRTSELANELRARVGEGAPPVVASVRLAPTDWVPLDPAVTDEPPPPHASVVACAGIARPSFFFDHVRDRFGTHEEVRFADHYPYDARDARGLRRRAGDRPIVVTEKDAVKLHSFADELGPTWVLRQTLSWAWGEDELRRLVVRAARASNAR